MSYLLVQGQQSMTLDSRRNQAYAEVLSRVITSESIVLDLGAGLGVHGFLAAQLGAKRVYLVEPEDIIAVADQIAKANGFGDRVKCLQGRIEDINLPESVDVIISVFTGNFLLEEDLLPSLFYARNKYLKPDGVLVPQAAVMEAVPVCAPELYQEEISIWSENYLGIDFSAAQSYATHSVYYYKEALSKVQYLAEPINLLTLDFYHSHTTHCQAEVTYTITESSLCHGWAGWFKMQLGEKWLSTAPHEPQMHWSPAFLPLDPPITMTAGEQVTFKLQRPLGGDWNWQVETSTTRQHYSTFFAVPLTLNSLKKASLDYLPQLTNKGQAAQYVLSHSDGSLSVQQISNYLNENYPALFTDSTQALKFVQSLIKRYG